MIRASKARWFVLLFTGLLLAFGSADAQQTSQNPAPTGTANQGPRGLTSYMPVDITESFSSIFARLTAEKARVEAEHRALLEERYDLSDRPAPGVTMDRSKPVQEGVRVKLPAGVTWQRLAAMSPDQIRDQDLFPKGFYPLPHPKHQEGGFGFPQFEIDAL